MDRHEHTHTSQSRTGKSIGHTRTHTSQAIHLLNSKWIWPRKQFDVINFSKEY